MGDNAIHVTPRDDLVLHEPNEECVCVPECCPNELPDGSIVYVYVHHALDRRDDFERSRMAAHRMYWGRDAST